MIYLHSSCANLTMDLYWTEPYWIHEVSKVPWSEGYVYLSFNNGMIAKWNWIWVLLSSMFTGSCCSREMNLFPISSSSSVYITHGLAATPVPDCSVMCGEYNQAQVTSSENLRKRPSSPHCTTRPACPHVSLFDICVLNEHSQTVSLPRSLHSGSTSKYVKINLSDAL